MSKMKWMAGSCFALALTLLAWGCSGKAGLATPFDTSKAEHPSGWIQVHYAGYAASADQCRSCHGSTTDPAQAGGIAKVSCFSCHTGPGQINHPAGWADPMQHGRNGAELAPNLTDKFANAGFAKCAKCHGSNYDNGPAISCRSCHVKAPHPNKPWLSTTLTRPTHVEVTSSNAPECKKCHFPGSANNPAGWPATPAPAGTAPGCFNNTLCHGASIPAAAGTVVIKAGQP